ncbi:uncharacterized protein LOC127251430 [Andrographis paniculata]|uniref:uncharacterized protein LOC127251430 n=1 Tax=Andrographis paniculata TaxID=175694 RepID=UPI0021E80EE7|nr:uncharacterized protein LOC127251430 [Andrographis paniculata]
MESAADTPMKQNQDGGFGGQGDDSKREETNKPYFRPAKDDTKPLLQDPILRSDPIETEEAVLRLPPLPDCLRPKS